MLLKVLKSVLPIRLEVVELPSSSAPAVALVQPNQYPKLLVPID